MTGIECAFSGRVGGDPELKISAAGKRIASVAVGKDEDVQSLRVAVFDECKRVAPAAANCSHVTLDKKLVIGRNASAGLE